jgi:hypothetical protein
VHPGPIQSRESDCNAIAQREYGRFGMRLFRFREATAQGGSSGAASATRADVVTRESG